MAKIATKPNVRSFRFSDEVAAIIAQQQGKNDNDRFEQLVLTCFYRLPQAEQRLGDLQQQILDKLGKLRELETLYERMRKAEAMTSNCIMQLDRLSAELIEINSDTRKVKSGL